MQGVTLGMYLDYWGFKDFPFDNAVNPDFFHLSKTHEEGLSRLMYAAEQGKGCALLTGDVGCGKTTLVQVLARRLPADRFDVAMISNPCNQPMEFLREFLYAYRFEEAPGSKAEILRTFERRLLENQKQGRENLFVVDEAQGLSIETLEEIRLLLNFRFTSRLPLTLLLVGQPELISRVRAIPQLQQRVALQYRLGAFDLKETVQYILFREKKAGARKNVFSREAVERVYKHSQGIPRVINNLCDLALLLGYGQGQKLITSTLVEDILNDGAIF